MKEFEFTLVVDGGVELTPAVEDALFQAGCGDATVSLRQGRIYLDFCRWGFSQEQAIFSAMEAVRGLGLVALESRVGESGE